MPSRREIILGLVAAAASMWSSLPLQAVEGGASESVEARKACILVWLDGGPSTIDMWNLPSDQRTRGPFGTIPTAGAMEINEHLSKTAEVMDELSIVRSMSTREVHDRAYYYAHTGFVPNPNVKHPSAGAVIAQHLAATRSDLKLPSFVSINGSSLGSGYLDRKYAPFVVDSRGQFLKRLDLKVDAKSIDRRLGLLGEVDREFAVARGSFIDQHQQAKQHALRMIQSDQIDVFRIHGEDPQLRKRYGDNDFGHAMLIARRLVEAGVPFVEVNLPGWDAPTSDYFVHLRENLLPQLDSGLSTLVHDLKSRGRLRHTVIVVMGAYGRSPRIGPKNRREPWTRSWSLLMGGGGLRGGRLVGQTTADGARVTTDPISFEDVWTTVAKSMGIEVDAKHVTRRGRPIRIFNGGQPIRELLDE